MEKDFFSKKQAKRMIMEAKGKNALQFINIWGRWRRLGYLTEQKGNWYIDRENFEELFERIRAGGFKKKVYTVPIVNDRNESPTPTDPQNSKIIDCFAEIEKMILVKEAQKNNMTVNALIVKMVKAEIARNISSISLLD